MRRIKSLSDAIPPVGLLGLMTVRSFTLRSSLDSRSSNQFSSHLHFSGDILLPFHQKGADKPYRADNEAPVQVLCLQAQEKEGKEDL